MRASVVVALLALVLLPQAAMARDRDRDGLPDRWERQNRLSVAKKSANGDSDRDSVDNRNELREGTRPRDRDSDDDGLADGLEDRDRDGLSNAAEDLTGNDPRVRDSDDDGVVDGKEAVGVVTSFDGGVLAVQVGKDTVYALVTPDTEVECESEDSLERHYGRAGKRGSARRQRRGNKRGSRSAVVSQFGAGDEDPLEDEGLLDEELEDELGLDEEEDLAEEDDFAEEDDELGHSTCPDGVLGPGARVHDAELLLSEDGLAFEYLALVR